MSLDIHAFHNSLTRSTYIHVGIHLSNSLIVNRKSVNFYTITCKFFHDLKKKTNKYCLEIKCQLTEVN